MSEVTFYSWIENQPSSLTVRIEGGEMGHSGGEKEDKMSIRTTLKEIRFNKGILRTSDKQTIETLRWMASQGETITEDHEVYLSHILSDKEKTSRSVRQAQTANEDNKKLKEENERLKKQLAAKPRGLGKKDEPAENASSAT